MKGYVTPKFDKYGSPSFSKDSTQGGFLALQATAARGYEGRTILQHELGLLGAK